MIAGLRELAPDVLLLQEAFRTDDGAVDTATTLARELGLHAATAPARAKPRLWRGAPTASTSGLAILARWPLTQIETIGLPSDAAGGERIALLAGIDTPLGNVLAATIHLSHLRADHAMRARQLSTLLNSPRWKQPAVARFFGGDINATADAPEMAGLAGHAELAIADTAVLAGVHVLPATHPLPPRPGREGRRIDFIFSVAPRAEHAALWTRAAVELAAPVGGVWPSDHAAVIADVSAGGARPDRPSG